MLGRHVYRVGPLDGGQWSVCKDGEAAERGRRPSRDEAVRYGWELAKADEPSKLVVEGPNGAITDERLFGTDTASDLERATGSPEARPKGKPPARS